MVVTYLDASPGTGQLTEGDGKEVIRAEETNTGKIAFINQAVIPLVIGRRDVGESGNPTTQDDGDAA